MTDQQPERKLSLRRKLVFAALTALFFFAAFEAALRLIGFQASNRVEAMQFTFPIDDYNVGAPQPFLQRDDRLFWKPRPGVLGHNSHGFAGPEFSIQKPGGVFRIVCIGDSCTHFGPDSYPDLLQAILDRHAVGKFEVINAGVIGYTSFQGMTLLRDQVLSWSPDLVTVYYGWNDHWLARNIEDKDQSGEHSATVDLLDRFRIVQLVSLATSGASRRTDTKMRVEPGDYRNNLQEISRLCQQGKTPAWLLTAPQALDISIPPYLLTSGEVLHPERLVQLHQSYNAIVREVAQQDKTRLIDLESEMDKLDKRSLFVDDHIHLSDTGKLYVAQRLFTALSETGLITVKSEGDDHSRTTSE